MTEAERFRALVEARAGGACEYCRLLQLASGVTFHLEHVRPLVKGGTADALRVNDAGRLFARMLLVQYGLI